MTANGRTGPKAHDGTETCGESGCPNDVGDVAKRSVDFKPAQDCMAPGSSRPISAAVGIYEYVESPLQHGPDVVVGEFPATAKSYAFITLTDDIADTVRGDVPDVEGTPVMLIGDNFGKHYYRSHDGRTVPVDLLEALVERDLVLVRGVEGGWSRWEGRPEWSDTYADLRDVEVVDMAAEVEERRGGEGVLF